VNKTRYSLSRMPVDPRRSRQETSARRLPIEQARLPFPSGMGGSAFLTR